ncbi:MULTISPECIES: LysR family transcriptional regulator [Devosia]|uniref:LysR family transcriptional regulator n=1 Tax=Devosia TaxID=46913 RepID=UPI000CE98765|nr:MULTISPECIES: LysR family transcriptional regulator [Devosia]AVF03343.1 transcriptional regulator [Devosia sp. I507]
MDRLDELQVLIAVVETGSLRQAALRLRRSPPAITRALAQLEDRLSRQLVERTTRKLSITEAGRDAYEQALALTRQWQDLAAQPLAAPVRGVVRITAPPVFGQLFLGAAIDGFLARWPDAQAEILLEDRYLDFIEYGLDAAVRLGRLPDSGLRTRKVGEVRWIVVASPSYLLARGRPGRPDDVFAHQIIAESGRSGAPTWDFRDTEPMPLQPHWMSNDIEMQRQAARAGHGLARFLNYQVGEDLRDGRLLRVLQDYEPAPLPVQIVTSGARHADGKVQAIATHLADHLRPILARTS